VDSLVDAAPLQVSGGKLYVVARKTVITLFLPGFALAVACLLPFLNKAYTIDDPWFLFEARQILKTPLQPMSFPVCWMGNETCLIHAGNLGAGTTQGLMGYLLVPVILVGGSERAAHLLQIFLVSIAILAMVKLSLRLGFTEFQAAIAGMLMTAIPPFLSMASTAMPDIAALALGLTGTERLLAWKQEQHWHQGLIASLALGLAPYARPQIALLLPLGAIWLFDHSRIQKARSQFWRQVFLWLPIAVASCILLAVNLLLRDRSSVVESADILVGSGHFRANIFAYLRYLFFPIPFTAVLLAIHWRRALFLMLTASIPVLISHFLATPWRSVAQEWQVAAVFCSFVVLANLIYQHVKTQDHLGLLLDLWILIPAPATVYVHFPLKYMLAALPAIVLILIKTISALPRRRQFWTFGALIFVCAAFSFLLLVADNDFAEYGRRAAAELIAPHIAKGEKVWFNGQWGFYWYALEAGASVSKPGELGPNPGDLLAVGTIEGADSTLNRFPHRELIDERCYNSPHGRTVEYGAGLYSNLHGHVPWRWNPAATNDYQVWRIH
jgi:hypothetical protein